MDMVVEREDLPSGLVAGGLMDAHAVNPVIYKLDVSFSPLL